jgi:hypothetical protein
MLGRVGLLAKLLLGNGTLKPELRAELEAEGLVLLEENLRGRIAYRRFRAPGRRFNGKVVWERMALGISEARFVLYCRSGRAELIDSPFSEPRWNAVDVSLVADDALSIHVDYDRMGEPKVSGEVTIRVRTPSAVRIVDELNARVVNARVG